MGELVVQQNNSLSGITVLSYGASSVTQVCSVAGTANVMLNGTQQPWSSFFSPGQTVNVGISPNQNTSNTFGVTALANALTGDYTLEVAVPASACGPAHTVDMPITIVAPQSKTTNNYIIVQGYALFRISKTDANDVFGYAVSPLYTDYSLLPAGTQSRLVPWN